MTFGLVGGKLGGGGRFILIVHLPGNCHQQDVCNIATFGNKLNGVREKSRDQNTMANDLE